MALQFLDRTGKLDSGVLTATAKLLGGRLRWATVPELTTALLQKKANYVEGGCPVALSCLPRWCLHSDLPPQVEAKGNDFAEAGSVGSRHALFCLERRSLRCSSDSSRADVHDYGSADTGAWDRATTAIFSLIHAVMLNSLPVADLTPLYRIGIGKTCCYLNGPQVPAIPFECRRAMAFAGSGPDAVAVGNRGQLSPGSTRSLYRAIGGLEGIEPSSIAVGLHFDRAQTTRYPPLFSIDERFPSELERAQPGCHRPSILSDCGLRKETVVAARTRVRVDGELKAQGLRLNEPS